MLNKQEFQTISQLLFTGKWNLSLEESNKIVLPLINKIAQEIDALEKDGKKHKKS